MMDVLISPRYFISGKMSQAIYNFPPEIETSPLPKSLDEKLTISIWQVGVHNYSEGDLSRPR